jgi:hypothetical protein
LAVVAHDGYVLKEDSTAIIHAGRVFQEDDGYSSDAIFSTI